MAKYRLCGGLAMMADHDMEMLKGMSAKGWHVSGLSCGFLYRFEQGAPRDFDYAVGFERDFTPEVQELFRAGGWHPVITGPGWQILRAEAGETPLFTDEESKEEALRAVRARTGRFALAWAVALAACLAAEAHFDAQGTEPIAAACLVGAVVSSAGFVFTAFPFLGYTASLRKLRAGR
ncbi:DUF2812 domain-containing protein [Rubneribacter sp.]|nr:DUF2812 domain-containing protein [Candidatus Rubneribacter avistercoris]